MSADNWAYCPRCETKRVIAEQNRAVQITSGYGKRPADEYIALINDAKTPLPREQTLREDYEIGTDGKGEFSVSYRCFCTACDFNHSFKHTERLKV